MLQRVTPFVLVLLCASFSLAQAQNGAGLLNYNARSAGRAGAGLGFFDSPELMATNPAGISASGLTAQSRRSNAHHRRPGVSTSPQSSSGSARTSA